MLTSETMGLIALLAALGWFWLDSARAREIATGLADRICAHYGYQFLDGTAALSRIGVRWTRQGLRLRRLFRFEYSEAGIGRHTGHIALLGTELEEASLGLPGGGHSTGGEGSSTTGGGPRRLD